MNRKSIELAHSSEFTIEEVQGGTRIHGRLAYPGISKNLKLYTIDQLIQGHGMTIPIWLNHADPIGTDDIGPELLPDFYRQKLQNRQVVTLGEATLQFNPETMELLYEGLVTDPFYKKREILQQLSVSQGVLHPKDLPEQCDSMFCYTVIKSSIYEEMSLVFHPGFSIATLSVENIENDQAYNIRNVLQSIMESQTTDKSKEGCGCGKSGEVEQAGGTMSQAGNCGEGMYWDAESKTCKPVNESGNKQSNFGANGSHENEEDDDMTKAEKKVKEAEKALENINKELDAARENLSKVKENEDEDEEEDEEEPEENDKKDKTKEKKKGKESKKSSEYYPNADAKSRAKAQEQYNDALEKKYKAIEAQQNAISQLVRSQMSYAKEHAQKNAIIGSKTASAEYTKAIESAHTDVKKWMDTWVKSPEAGISPVKSWKLTDFYTDQFVQKKFKSIEGMFLTEKYIPYKEHMKSIEATDVQMSGGTPTGDVNNWQRTLSELVLVYPDGRIITPIIQFCEAAILPPGKKQHIFYNVNVPTYAATDEANMDAAGSGYALAPSEITIGASGGSTNPLGALSRIGFTQLEEIPIDLIQKINIGHAMEGENQKNLAVLTTCYNDDTAYNVNTDSIAPKGGGNKGAADNQGNTHWINGNSAAHLTSTDSGATGALKFAGLMEAKRTIAETGLDVSNLKMYLDYGGILQVVKDTDITTYTQRSVPEVITEGYIERISGIDLIASSQTAVGASSTIKRGVVFIPVVSFGFVTGRELQMDAERVARQQSFFVTGSLKVAAFCKKMESTCRVSFTPSA